MDSESVVDWSYKNYYVYFKGAKENLVFLYHSFSN